ncbi:MAG: DNA polymerase [Firmicutes bacterium]|nr:DNA polymerase [Bacillota bacterium]
MDSLEIDIETFSSNDLVKGGVYKYVEADDFEILLFGYSVDGSEVEVIDLVQGEKIPDDVLSAITDKSITKWAHNSNFERICLSEYLRRNYPERFVGYGSEDDTVGKYLDPVSWKCSMIWAAYMGLPLSLKDVGAVLQLGEQKLDEGKSLIRYFCLPCKPTKANGGRTRNLPHHAPDKWESFKKYNKRDVEVEIGIMKKLANFPVPDFVWDEYHLDQQINDRGIEIDMILAENAVRFDELAKTELKEAVQEITQLENPNSVVQMKEWLAENGLEVDSLGKKAVTEMLGNAPPKLAKVLTIRQQLSKSSVKKYQAMVTAACKDNRARGMFRFYGANRTGRFCLAEGSMIRVLTTSGNDTEKPIEEVNTEDMVWDGEQWVNHEGVVYSGDKPVMTWDGVTATPEHMVYVSKNIKMSLGEAMERGLTLWKGNIQYTE